MKVSQFPRNADSSSMKLMAGVLTDESGNNGERLKNTPIGPDGNPLEIVGLVLVDMDGNFQETLGALTYKGVWNASTNVPAIPAAAPLNKGEFYKVSVAGTTNIDGINDWAIGDWIISNGATWDKIDNSELVTSVAGKIGAVTLVKADVGLGLVDNTADINKPVSVAQQAALDLKVNLASLAASGGAALVGRSGGGTVADGIFLAGRAAPIAGSKMQIDRLIDSAAFPLEDRAGIWTGNVVTRVGLNGTFTSSDGQAGSPSQTLFVCAVNNGSPGDIVGATIMSVAAANNTTVFGANILAIGTGKDNCRFIGFEVDVEPTLADTNPAAGCAGLYINVFNKVLNGAFLQTGGVGGGLFENGIILGGMASTGAGLAMQSGAQADTLINCTVGTFTTAAALYGVGATKSFKWASNGGGIYFDGTHQRIIMPNTGGALIVRNAADTVSMAAFDTGGNLDLQNGGTVLFTAALSSATATAGAATLPTNPVGFLTMRVDGTNRKFPYYAN